MGGGRMNDDDKPIGLDDTIEESLQEIRDE